MSTVALTRPTITIHPVLGVGLVLGAGTLFALNGTVSKLLLLGGFDAAQLTTFRATGAFFLLFAMSALVSPGPRRLAVRRQEIPRLIIFGLAGFFLVPMLYFVAISRLPVGIGLLFEFTGPVFVALWVRFGERRHVKPRLWVGLVLCLAGLAGVAEVWGGELRLDGLGVAAALACAVLLAAYYIIGTKTVTQRDPLSLTCWAFGISAVAGAITRPWWSFSPGLLTGTSGGMPMWLLAGYLLIFGTTFPYLMISASMQHLPPTSIGVIGMFEPVLASAIAWVLLGELLSTAQIVGGLVVLGGVVLAETARATANGRAPDLPPA